MVLLVLDGQRSLGRVQWAERVEAFPLLGLLRGRLWFAGAGVRALSLVISALGAFWLVQRLLG